MTISIVLGLIFTALFIFVKVKCKSLKVPNIVYFLLYFIYFVFSTIIVTEIATGNIGSELYLRNDTVVLINFVLICAFVAISYIVSLGTKWGCLVVSIPVFIIGIANSILYLGRGKVLQLVDFSVVSTALSVAKGYRFVITSQIVLSFLLLAFGCLFFMFCVKTNSNIKTRGVSIGISILLIAVLLVVLAPYNNQDKLNENEMLPYSFHETDYGFFANMFVGNVYRGMSEPNNYVKSLQLIDKYSKGEDINISTSIKGYNLRDYDDIDFYTSLDFLDGEFEKPDNVIIVMAESLCRINKNIYSEWNKYEIEEYLPFISSLIDNPNVISGAFCSTSIGGSTANSEYEMLTGGSVEQFKFDEYMYSGKIKSAYPSIVDTFEKNGYATMSLHNYYKRGYNRENVYKLFGFDESYFIEDSCFSNAKTLRGYVKDSYGFDKVLSNIEEKDENTFNFFVTMQGHGDFFDSISDEDFKNNLELERFNVRITKNAFEKYKSVFETYTTVQNSFDKQFESFIKSLEKSDENNLVILFGDHRMGFDFCKMTEPNSVYRYFTPLVIWSNYSLPNIGEKQLLVGANYLGSIICKIAGVQMTDFEKMSLEMYEEMPCIMKYMYVDSELNFVRNYSELEDTTVVDLLRTLTYLQVNDYERPFFYIDGRKK